MDAPSQGPPSSGFHHAPQAASPLTWVQPFARPAVLTAQAASEASVASAAYTAARSTGHLPAARGISRRRLRGRRRQAHSALRQALGGKDVPQTLAEEEHGSSPGDALVEAPDSEAVTAEEEEPWTIEQFISILSGVVGSVLSATGFFKQREATMRGAMQISSATTSRRTARIVQQLGGSLLDAEAESPLFSLGAVPQCTDASDLRRPGRHFTIITTAALPWLTGTAVNPLLRALNLARSGRPVVLVLPWIEQDQQRKLFPSGKVFDSQKDQEVAVLEWCKERAKIDPAKLPLTLRWYNARFVQQVCSIFPRGDISAELNAGDPRDVLILEEPEHLCWYHHGQRWPGLFSHVIGVVHTNYQDYLAMNDTVSTEIPPAVKEFSIYASCNLVCSAYCDVNIKLSDTIMPLPNEVTQNVHGVRDEFIAIGDSMAGAHGGSKGSLAPGDAAASSEPASVYYLGKAIYEKGWGELLALLEEAGDKLAGLKIDGFGSGMNYDGIADRADKLAARASGGAVLRMHPGRDHAQESIHGYSVLVNPSTSDVLCTVTVEALAMGKHAVLARHPSNRFFEQQFPGRCHFFAPGDTDGFIAALKAAIAAGPPQPLPKEQRYALTWEAATERLFEAAEVRVLSGRFKRPSEAAISRLAYQLHFDTMKDKAVLGDIIKEATLGDERLPWDEYFANWRTTYLGDLRSKVLEGLEELQKPPAHIQPHEQYLKDRINELQERFKIR